ncbi:MAG: hypothetical protein A2521_09300 [Deltaproteobacteria bacterium RIFOXYD12_FULL_57_12]|nr:MAG: hypothetical protein A2521_09300 [Deltaproteobacteria bacterium RIFOXYD12_FULL_57_12]
MTAHNKIAPYRVTVVMPAYNEEKCLAASVANVLASFTGLAIDGQLIIVNDGSIDGTGALADRLAVAQPAIAVIHHQIPQGIGGAFWGGVGMAAGEVVVMVPGDGENDAGEILKHLPRMEQADVVVPFVVNPEVRSLKRRLLSLLYGRIINLSFGLSLRYLNGTVMYRTELLHGLELRSSGFFYQAELLIKTIRQGARYVEVPCRLQQRRAGQSKAVTWSSFGHVMRAYLAIFSEVYLAR